MFNLFLNKEVITVKKKKEKAVRYASVFSFPTRLSILSLPNKKIAFFSLIKNTVPFQDEKKKFSSNLEGKCGQC